MIVDNFEQILKFIDIKEEFDDFYFLQIIKRRKEKS